MVPFALRQTKPTEPKRPAAIFINANGVAPPAALPPAQARTGSQTRRARHPDFQSRKLSLLSASHQSCRPVCGSLELGLQMFALNPGTTAWSSQGHYSATLAWSAAPHGYPSSLDYLEGSLKADATGLPVGQFSMGWVSPHVRKAIVEIDSASGSEQPMDSGAVTNWQTVSQSIGWDISVSSSQNNITVPANTGLPDAELHRMMLEYRDKINLDREWRFHILVVPYLASTSRGIMYDADATDANNVPREGDRHVFPLGLLPKKTAT